MSQNTTPDELLDLYDDSVNPSLVIAGRSDAVYHVGKLISGGWTPEFITDLQNELADTTDPGYDAQYHYGYLTAWNSICGLFKGQSLKDIAKYHG